MQAYFKGGMSRFNSKGVFFLQQGVVIEGQHFSGNLKKQGLRDTNLETKFLD